MVAGRPPPIALEAEILYAQAGLALVGDHVRTPVLEVLDAPDLDGRIVDVDPVVWEHFGPIDHHRNADEVAIREALGGTTHAVGRRGIQARDQFAHRHARDEVAARVLLDRASSCSGGDRPYSSRLVLDALDRASVQHRPALLAMDLRHPLPHLPWTEPGLPEPVDQRGHHIAPIARTAPRHQRTLQDQPQVDALDALRRPVRRELLGADTPHLLRVGLEQDAEKTPPELVPHPVLEASRIADRPGARG